MRTTHTPPVTITCEEWQPHEYIMLRTSKTAADTQWITARSTVSVVDKTAEDGLRVTTDNLITAQATIARLAIGWSLLRDRVDHTNNPIYRGDGRTVDQEPIPFPTDQIDNALARMHIISEWNELDLYYVLNALGNAMAQPMQKQEQQDFLPSVNGPSSTNSETMTPSLSR